MQSVMTNYFKDRILFDLTETVTEDDYAGILVPANVSIGLFTGAPTLSQETILADLTQPTFGGYAIAAMTAWTAPLRDSNGNYYILGNQKNFICTGSPTSDTVTGFFLVDNTTTPDKLLMAQVFDNPVLITQIGSALTVTPKVVLPFDMSAGESCTC